MEVKKSVHHGGEDMPCQKGVHHGGRVYTMEGVHHGGRVYTMEGVHRVLSLAMPEGCTPWR
jgi:hypothetical protein